MKMLRTNHLGKESSEKQRPSKRFNAAAELKAVYEEYRAKRIKIVPSFEEPEEIIEEKDERKIKNELALLAKLGIDKETYEKMLPEEISELEKKRRKRPQPKDFEDVVYEEFTSMWEPVSQLNNTTSNRNNQQSNEVDNSRGKKFVKVNKIDKSKKREIIILKTMTVKEANAALAKWRQENED